MKHLFIKISSRGKSYYNVFRGSIGATGPIGAMGIIGPIKSSQYNVIGITGSIGPIKNI